MSTYLTITIIMWIVLFVISRKRKQNNKTIIMRQILKKVKKENTEVIELAKRFIGKECMISAFDSGIFTGVIKEVNGGAILIEEQGETEVINLNFVISISEFPRNKKGKKKRISLDITQ